MNNVQIFADFNNADRSGRLRLNCEGTILALKRHNVDLREGMKLLFTDGEEFQAEGFVTYSTEEKIWVATIDWRNLERDVGMGGLPPENQNS